MTKPEKLIWGAMLAIQAVLLLTIDPVVASIAPALLAAVPLAYAAARSDQTVRMMKPRLRRAYVSISVLAVAVAASFLLVDSVLSFKLLVVRALFTDVLVIWLAVALLISHKTRRAALSAAELPS
jgi:hypothetical protein